MNLEEYLLANLIYEDISSLNLFSNKFLKKSIIKTLWFVMEWVGKNISYDAKKAEVIKKLRYTPLQKPIDTLISKKGTCMDYAILITAILLNINISPVYLGEIKFKYDSYGHVVALINYLGEYIVLDQNLPIYTLPDYIYKLKLENKNIDSVLLYKITKQKKENQLNTLSINYIGKLNEVITTNAFSNKRQIPINIVESQLKKHISDKLNWSISNKNTFPTKIHSYRIYLSYFPELHYEILDYVYNIIIPKNLKSLFCEYDLNIISENNNSLTIVLYFY